ncbi:tetratricopeptide repeat-containing sensor histidine kinase [Tenacibaculum aiptasiae]|uniref:tetratricopeptide repeat-containing sensor histidine kinase n=1 Tax=Tenacibaculum aiptasiae TaxID=426481 RepID=UPI00232D1F6E|nr:tetratricopeptide repeat-containing sensor histidine kinase [Tenacibaculum aiptasiae]
MIRKKQILLIIIIVIIGCRSNKEEEKEKKKKTSCELRFKQGLKDYKIALDEGKIRNQIKSLKTISYCCIKLGEYKKTIGYAHKIIPLIDKEKELKSYSFAYFHIGLGHRFLKQNDSAYFYYKKSNEINLRLKDTSKIIRRLFNIASIESENELYLKSDSTAIEGLRYSMNKPRFNSAICSIYNCLGINSNRQKKYNEAIEWFEKAIKFTTNKEKVYRYKNNIANNYLGLKEYDSAIVIYKKIMESSYFDKLELKLKSTIIGNYAFNKFLLKKNVEEEEFLKSQELKIKIKDFDGLITNYSYLSDFNKKKNRSKSLHYAYEMRRLAKKHQIPNERVSALDRIIDLEEDSKLRKLVKERQLLKDSIVEARRISQSKLVKVIYNNEELEKQNLKVQIDVEKQKSQKQLLLFLGITSVLGFISYVFYKRNKTKREKIIEVYKTETRLAKKIHDELANDMYLAMNKLQKEERDDTSILYDLEKIYSLTRNISHENSPVVTGELFEDFLKQLFVDFTTDSCKVMNKGLSEVNVNDLRKEKQIVLYRLLQELLVNMTKHSQASLAVISFSLQKDTIQVQYKDNGIGTNTVTIKNGLKNMETRIKSIGGTIIFESENEKGFKSKFQFKK